MMIGEVADWKIFKRLSILPLFETITRNGAGVSSRLILACLRSSGMPSRTLSRFKLVCPSKTASARARWRNKCSLSSRDVKSTGAKLFVVTLPSTVMAKVAVTNGRLKMWKRSWRRDRRRSKVPSTFLFGFTDLVFQSDHFFLHFAQAHMASWSAWLVKEINQSPGKTAKE